MSAKLIIDRFGGQTALAKLLGKGQSTVGYWAKSGVIPSRWHGPLLDLALRMGMPLSPHDFLPEPEEHGKQLVSASTVTTAPSSSAPDEVDDGGAQEAVNSPFLFYTSDDGTTKVQVMVGDDTVWATLRGMAEIFGVEENTIGYHVKNVYESQELPTDRTTRKIRVVRPEGARHVSRDLDFYNLDMIISVGYRVNSGQATKFRIWATRVLTSYLIKGFALDEDRLKQGKQLFGKDYFDELLEKIREIRASERRFYQKITDLYAQCSIDYDKDSPITQQFYAHVQDKLHYAIHGHTSAELIKLRADASKPHMGLQTWNNQGRGGKITKLDVTVGKNYLTSAELEDLNRLVSMYLDWAENFARRQMPMRMEDWAEKMNGFLEFNAYSVLNSYGGVRRSTAERAAVSEYEKFRVVQDAEYRSDFDEVIDAVKSNKRLPKT